MTQRVVNYTYGTGNPVLPDGSIDVRDGIDNLQSMDVFMNAPEDTYNQRDGEIVRTVAGMNNEFDAHILNMGFTRIGTFATGATLTNPRQTLLWDVADGGDGQEYGWSGAFPKVVPAASTPESTGGISVGAWISRFDPELRIQVREALLRSYAEAGHTLVDGSFEAGGTLTSSSDVLLQESSGKAYSGAGPFPQTVAAGTNPTSGGFVDRGGSLLRQEINKSLIFKKSISLSLPFKFPDYDTAFAFVGSPSYIYPQGHCYDSAGNVYIKYARGTYSVIAWYTKAGVYGGYFYIQPGGESLVIIDNGTQRTLYSKGGTNRLYSHNINTMPVNGAVVPFTDVGLSSVGLQYAYNSGRWIVEQISPDVGVDGSRTKWNIYNSSFVKTGEFYVQKNAVGWQLPESSLYNYIPKTQGMCLKEDRVIFGLGGSYIPENDGPQSLPVAAFGIAEVGLDGSILGYGVVNAAKLITSLNDNGYPTIRTESEGVTLRGDGAISHLFISANPTTPGNTTRGLLVFIEKDVDGDDYSDIAEPYIPFDWYRASTGIFPRGVDGLMHNPFTDEVMSSMDQLIQYMRGTQIPRLSWYSSAVTITPLPGITIPSSMLVEMSNANNLTFIVQITGSAAGTTSYSVNYNESTLVYTVTKLGTDAASLRVGTGGEGADSLGRLLFPHKVSGEEDVLVFSAASTSANNSVTIGGSSSLFNAATILDFYTAPNQTTLTGTHRLRIDSAGNVRPGVDNTQPLGISAVRWSVVYAGTGTINTSDADEKTPPLPISDFVIDAWGDVQIITFQWLESIRLKGEDGARWHFGVIAQQVRDAFAARGLDGTRYGLLCYDEWGDQFESVIDMRENPETGEYEEYETGEVRRVIAAGHRWGIRPDQCLFLEAAYQRRERQRDREAFEAFKSDITARLTALEGKA